jgi:fibronectin type 3 domain-containing protein
MKDMKKAASIGVISLLTIGSFLLVFSFASHNASAAQWTIEQVEGGWLGDFSSLAIDSNNHSHISYYDASNGDLKYAKWDGASWNIETVDRTNDVGKFTSIALDSNDHPHISYFNATSEELKYAYWTGSLWNIQTVDDDGSVGGYTSIAMDKNDHPHISYYEYSGTALKYANWNGTSWNIETVDRPDRVGEYSSIALDSNDYPHIGYYDLDNRKVKYAYWNGSTWKIQVVDTVPGGHTSLALDSNDYPHICYLRIQDLWLSVKSWLRYASWNGTSWNIKEVDSGKIDYPFKDKVGMYSSIVIDANDDSHVSYIDEVNNQLKYAKRNGSSWSKQVVGGGGSWTSIALNSENYVRISYSYSGLKYAIMLPPIPYPPTNLKANHGNGYINLTWNAPTDEGGAPITNYNVYRKTGSGEEEFLLDVGNVTTYNDTTVSNGETYYYRVTAENSYGESPKSNQAGATPGEPPSAPLNLNAKPGDKHIVLTWDPPASNGTTELTGYYVYWGFDLYDVNTSPNIIPVGMVLTYEHSPLSNGQSFFYKITAENSVGEGAFSTVVNATPGKPPSAPQNPLAVPGDSEIVVTWSAPQSPGDSPITNYKLYRGNASGEETLLTTLENELIYVDKSVLNDKAYYYKVSAVSSLGEGPYSSEVNATPKANAPPADSDSDDLPDTWELEHFGDLSQSGDDDFDGDGFNNLWEYSAGSDPSDDFSVPPDDDDGGNPYLWLGIIIILVIIVVIAIFIKLFSPRKGRMQ